MMYSYILSAKSLKAEVPNIILNIEYMGFGPMVKVSAVMGLIFQFWKIILFVGGKI